jgi:signal peptidase complex subunit 3
MHTVWVRLNAVVFFGLSALLGFSVLAAISKIGHSYRHVPGEYKYVFSINFKGYFRR